MLTRTLFMKFFSVIDLVGPIRTLTVKSNTKPQFDSDALNTIQNYDNHYKKFKRSDKETDKGNFKCAKFYLKNNRK